MENKEPFDQAPPATVRKTRTSTVRMTQEGMEIWNRLAARRGLSRSAYLEMIFRELAAREQGAEVKKRGC